MRCKKAVNAFGEKVCRYRKQPHPPWNVTREWLENIELPYSEEVYELLEEIGLATKNSDEGSNRWKLDKSIAAGKWRYPADQREFFMASIPILSAITRSSTNVDMCDRKFQTSYLVK